MNFIEGSFNLFKKKKTLIPCEENAFKKIHLQKKEKEN